MGPPIVATAMAATSWAGVLGIPPFNFATEAPLSVSLVGGMVAFVAVSVMWLADRPKVRASLALVLIAWFGTSMQGLVGMPPPLVQVTAATGPLALVGLAYSLPSCRRYWVAALCVAAMVLHIAAYQPLLDPACLSPCTEVAAPLADRLGGREGLATALLPELAAYVVLVVAQLRGSFTTTERMVVIAVASCFLAADWIPWIRWGTLDASPAPDALRTLGAAIATSATAFLVLRIWRARRHLRVLVRELGEDRYSAIKGMQSPLFAVPDSSIWVDIDGRERPTAEGRTLPGPDGHPSVLLVESGSQGLIDGITPLTLLVLDIRRLTAVATWRLAQLRDSQARIVAASDRERHRIDRDLHDGAQQQLVAAAMHLAAARDRLDVTAATSLDRTGALIHDATAGLRTIAHRGLLTILTTEGLAAAVEDLAYSSPGVIDVSVDQIPELSASVERAAFAVVEFGLGTGRARAVHIRSRHGLLQVEVEVLGLLAEPVAVADRVGATGGMLTWERDPDGKPWTRLTGSWPCAL